jgi:hypothetical protein
LHVLFLIQGPKVAASRYRVLQYIPYLNSAGVETTVSGYPRNPIEFAKLLGSLPAYDCVFLQRKRFRGPMLGLVRKRAKKIVYDFDDSVMFRNSKAASPYSRTRMKRFEDMVKASDFVIAGNRFLMEQALPFNENVAVLPTALDGTRYFPRDYGKIKEKVTLGWIGDHGSIHYMEKMKPVFEKIGKKYANEELSIVCDVFIECENIPVVKKAWSQETEIADLQDMDIGLMPLMNDLWSEGKCGLKILQYFGVAVPAVCTPVGVNKDVVKDGITGFYANTPEEWVDRLSMLIDNADSRRRMGEGGHEIVMNSYTIEACAPKLLDILHRTAGESAKRTIVPASDSRGD